MSEQQEMTDAEERALDAELAKAEEWHRQWLESFTPEQQVVILKLREIDRQRRAHRRALDKVAPRFLATFAAVKEDVMKGPAPTWLMECYRDLKNV